MVPSLPDPTTAFTAGAPEPMIDDAHFRRLAEYMFDGVYVIDRERRIIYWNRAAEHITGYPRSQVVGSCCHDNLLIHVDEDGQSLCHGGRCPALAVFERREIEEAEVFVHHRDGHRLPVLTRLLPLVERDGAVTAVMEVFRDNSGWVSLQDRVEELSRLSLLDPLTELGNRRYIKEQLRGRFDELQRYGRSFGVLFCDVDRFKRFNDDHGHHVGDEVIKMVARTLLHCVRPFDFVGRWGGEEFIAVITRVERWQLYAIAERLRMLVNQSTVMAAGTSLRPTISVGATLARRDDSERSLFERVDRLLYQAKELGMDRVAMDAAQTPDG